jgi:hypothetical protein
MPRGIMPRQPARTGRQDRVARALPSASSRRALSAKAIQKESAGAKNARVGTGALTSLPRTKSRGPGRGFASAAAPEGRKKPTPKPAPAATATVKIKGYDPLAPERVAEILKRLDQLYPAVTCALTHASAWELLVATILSAQSTDVNVNRVTPELFRKYPTVEAFAALTPEQLEPDVRSTGFFRNKSKSVVGAAKKVVSDFGGQVPDDME